MLPGNTIKADPDHFVGTGEDLTIDEAHKYPKIFISIGSIEVIKCVPHRPGPG